MTTRDARVSNGLDCCMNCRFGDLDEAPPVGGELVRVCRLAPPAAGDGGAAAWPRVRLGDWCGEHRRGVPPGLAQAAQAASEEAARRRGEAAA